VLMLLPGPRRHGENGQQSDVERGSVGRRQHS
jgi:hypothetical protein